MTFQVNEIKWKGIDLDIIMLEYTKGKQAFLDLVQVAFILTDAHTKILYANRFSEHLFGYSNGELKGKRIRILFLEEDLIYFLPNIIHLTLNGEGFEGEVLLRQKNGSKIFVNLNTIRFKEDRAAFISFTFQEIQRLKRLERERAEVLRWAALGMMLEEVAHQIRNPIVVIGGYIQRLLNQAHPASKGRSYLVQMLKEAKKLENMIQKMEEYILIPKPIFQRVKIQKVVEAVLQEFSREAMDKGISIGLDSRLLKAEGDCFMDRSLFVKALSHLIENSIRAVEKVPMDGKRRDIKIILFGDDEKVGISITDKGEGIPKENRSRIFDPFFSTRPDRLGLGLTFVKRVIEEQGGNIQVKSRLKRGTTITLTFPKDRRRLIRRKSLYLTNMNNPLN